MSNAKKCDRCKCLYEVYSGIELQSKGNKYNSIYFSNGYRDKYCDLCQNCMSFLIDWIKKGNQDGDKE